MKKHSSEHCKDTSEGSNAEQMHSTFNMASSSSTSQYLSHDEVLSFSMAGGVREPAKAKLDRIVSTRTLALDNDDGKTSIISKESRVKKTSYFDIKEDDYEVVKVLKKYLRFVGPGLMISVAYMDPGNYATDVSAGASSRFSLLFIVLLSNIIAIFLQSLCIKLGSVTGLDLSRACRENLPRWLNLIIWFLAECAIIATDVAEVIGTAIALNVLIKVPLPAGVAITVVDVFFVLMAYRPGSSLKFVRLFEYAVALLVIGVVICFCVELALMPPVSIRQIFRGYAPSSEMFKGNGMYTATSILGATVMPHSLFLGSGLVQPRLREYDIENDNIKLPTESDYDDLEEAYYEYKPTSKAIKYALKYSIVELAITLFTFALFVNSAILIVAGSSLYGTEEAVDADLFTIHRLLSSQVAPVAGTLFMVALLFSGQSAGIVCTIAGQIVSEGHLRWTIKPWKRRIATRAISIIPCLVISISIGKNGLAEALNASQVCLSILLPFLTAPLIYFTCKKSIMTVEVGDEVQENGTELQELNGDNSEQVPDAGSINESKNTIDMSNNWINTIFAAAIWLFISVLNIYMIVKLGIDGGT